MAILQVRKKNHKEVAMWVNHIVVAYIENNQKRKRTDSKFVHANCILERDSLY